MREIKFRFWDDEYKKFHYFDLDELLKYGTANIYGCSCPVNIMPRNLYVGLRDKNGVEIYEGDIAEYKAWTGLDIGEITWGEKECCYFWEGATDCQPLGDIYQDIGIIGNVHENLELLEEEA